MQPGEAPHRTVLVVDDDPELRGTLADALREAGYIVATAHDGESALLLLHGIRVDLILVDLHMPGMSGLEFIERWNREPRRGAPVVVMTGSRRVESLPEGCASELRKPFTLQQLCDLVRRMVNA